MGMYESGSVKNRHFECKKWKTGTSSNSKSDNLEETTEYKIEATSICSPCVLFRGG